ncbi:uncharacterized protein LOC117314768 [Pecten maximus]|uniref:uncharacterized protein LOC117314768 n=1 Tax=Pecten maximus TaxID=6579 RepID=UPI0014582B0C|nr:uncharacterized protein LOC117314768 [Pecten maximus]
MKNSCQDFEEPHYSSIQSVCSHTGTGSDDEFTGTQFQDRKLRRTTSSTSDDSNHQHVDMQVMCRSIRTLNVSHGRHFMQPVTTDTSFPEIAFGHRDCLCCSRERKWVCWRMEFNRKMTDSILNGVNNIRGLTAREIPDHPARGGDVTADTEEFLTLAADSSCLPSHHYVMFGIPRARLHGRLRH